MSTSQTPKFSHRKYMCRHRYIHATGFPLNFIGFNGIYEIDYDSDTLRYVRTHDSFLTYSLVPSQFVFKDGVFQFIYEGGGGELTKYSSFIQTDATISPIYPHGDYNFMGSTVVVTSHTKKTTLLNKLVFHPPAHTVSEMLEIVSQKNSSSALKKFDRLPSNSEDAYEHIPVYLHTYSGPDRTPYTILYSHGNATDLYNNFQMLKSLATLLQTNILSYDYVGYSTSKAEGYTPSESGCKRAITTAYTYMCDVLDVKPEHVILVGRSVGSGPTLYLANMLAHREKIAGVFLISGILSVMSYFNTVKNIPALYSLLSPFDMFKNRDIISTIDVPIGFIHGEEDDVIEVDHTIQLVDQTRKLAMVDYIQGAGHNNISLYTIHRNIARFIFNLQTNTIE